jgi:Aminoglycoside-2''-adenylyltransferase
MADFVPVLQAAAVMQGFRRPWYVAGGWAIDLFIGRVTREHEDVDIAILRGDQAELRSHLASWTLEKIVDRQRSPWAEGERINPPAHEIHATREDRSPRHLEILLNESSDGLWRFRRNPAITRPLHRIGMRTPEGVPFLAPEVVLLFKAKAPVEKDVQDFELVRPRLPSERRRWLRRALETCHPGHPWLVVLG